MHNCGALFLIFLDLLHLELFTLPKLLVFFEILVLNKAYVFSEKPLLLMGAASGKNKSWLTCFLLLQKFTSLIFHVDLNRTGK